MTNTNMNNPEYGLLIDYEYCTGCHACEVACA
ncbi:4Fe-4S binding protein [Gemmatimonadota bacterium]